MSQGFEIVQSKPGVHKLRVANAIFATFSTMTFFWQTENSKSHATSHFVLQIYGKDRFIIMQDFMNTVLFQSAGDFRSFWPVTS